MHLFSCSSNLNSIEQILGTIKKELSTEFIVDEEFLINYSLFH
jgi:hypothetical protein